MPAGVPAPINFALEAGQAVTRAVADGRSPLEADIPSEVGGAVDVIWDVTYEQPAYADDSIDLPGGSVGDAVDGVTGADGAPDWIAPALGVGAVLVVVGALLWLVRPILSIGAEVVAE
jgi:hypothetical protein